MDQSWIFDKSEADIAINRTADERYKNTAIKVFKGKRMTKQQFKEYLIDAEINPAVMNQLQKDFDLRLKTSSEYDQHPSIIHTRVRESFRDTLGVLKNLNARSYGVLEEIRAEGKYGSIKSQIDNDIQQLTGTVIYKILEKVLDIFQEIVLLFEEEYLEAALSR